MTLNYILDNSRNLYGDRDAIGMALETPLTYSEFYGRVMAIAYRLTDEGVKKGDHVAILAENSHNWGVAYFAIVRLGAIVVPILPDLPEADVHHILTEMKVSFLFTTQRQIEKIYELKRDTLSRVVTLDDYVGTIGVVLVDPFSQYLHGANELCDEKLGESKEYGFEEIDEEDLAAILYTSGTSGFSKAVMLTHKNLTANAYSASSLIEVEPGAVFLSILPMSHTYEFTLGFILPLLSGARIAYAGKTPTPVILQRLCKEEKPFAMFAVPLVMEKIYKKRVLPKIDNSLVLSTVCRFEAGRKMIYKKIGAKLLEFFGGNLQLMGIGGAALNPDVEKFLHAAGFPYIIGYGMTESAPLLAGGPPGDPTIAIGSTGKPIPHVEIRIKNPDPETGVGEVAARGPNVMQGYWNDTEATEEVLSEDGWLFTGDLGYFDEENNLHIRGRSKNVIVMANGENVYPEPVEHKMNAFAWVVESLVVENNGRLDGWVYPDYELIDEETVGQNRSERHAYIEKLLANMKKEVNKQLPPASRLSQLYERREPFIKTATHKIKRYLYDASGKKNNLEQQDSSD